MTADSTGTVATLSASSTARRMELTVESRLTIRPLRRPLDSAAPRARKFTCSSSISAIIAQVFVLPISSPTMYLSFLLNSMLLPALPGFRDRYPRAGVGVQDHLPRILQIDGPYMACVGLPLRKIFDQHAIFGGKISAPKININPLRIGGSRRTTIPRQ